MSWFGWLTKGRCEISMLDGLTLLGELLAFGAFVVGVLLVVDAVRTRVNRRSANRRSRTKP